MQKEEWKYLFLIIIVFIAACIETDIYLPAFPDMMAAFSASEGAIQSLLTWNFVGICVSGPFYGPISDAYGRKGPLMIALGMFLIGSVVTYFAQNLEQMLWGRVLQGLGSGGCFTLGTAIIFDAFQKNKAIEALNALNTIVPIIMSAAPMAGAYLNTYYGFRSNFLTIGLFVLASFLICLFFFKETLAKEKRTVLQPKAVFRDFKEAFCCVPLWQLIFAVSLLFAGYISFLSGSAVLFVIEFGVSKALFPIFQAGILGAWVLGSLFLNAAIRRWGIVKIKKIGKVLAIIGTLELALAALVFPSNPWMLTLGVLFYAFGANWIIGVYFPECMEILPHIKGVAASLVTSARLLIAALVVALTSALYNATVYPLAAVIIGSTILLVPTLALYEKKAKQGEVKDYQAPSVHS